MIHKTEICAGYSCVGGHMFIVYSQWSFSAQLSKWGYHRVMLHVTDVDFRVFNMTLRG